MEEFDKKKWEDFVEAVKSCREMQGEYNGFSVWPKIQLIIGKGKIFLLNPYCVNLKSKEYCSSARNMITGKLEEVELKEALMIEE